MNIDTEVIIIGGGLTGLIAAKYFQKLAIDYKLLEKHKLTKIIKKDFRTTAINYAVCQNFQFLELWDDLEKNAAPIKNIFIKNQQHQSKLLFDESLAKRLPMGYILHNHNIKSILLDNIVNDNIIDDCNIIDICSEPGRVRIEVEGGDFINAKLAIIADGKFSNFKEIFNINNFSHNYHQTSYIFNIKHKNSHKNFALEQFLPSGPVAFLPLKNKFESSIVYSLDNNITFNETNILAKLNEIGSDHYGVSKIITPVNSYPLSMIKSFEYSKNRILFLGDALHSIHPVAGQGFNLTMRDIEKIVMLIQKYRSLGIDIGNKAILEQFKKLRYNDNILMSLYCHGLVKLFSNNSKLLNRARNNGLKLFGKSSLAKKSAISLAMGLN